MSPRWHRTLRPAHPRRGFLLRSQPIACPAPQVSGPASTSIASMVAPVLRRCGWRFLFHDATLARFKNDARARCQNHMISLLHLEMFLSWSCRGRPGVGRAIDEFELRLILSYLGVKVSSPRWHAQDLATKDLGSLGQRNSLVFRNTQQPAVLCGGRHGKTGGQKIPVRVPAWLWIAAA